MLNLKSILVPFLVFGLLFGLLLGVASTDAMEQRLGKWFINSSSTLFEWTLPQASINVEHDRNPTKYNPNEVWISPVGKEWLQNALERSRASGQQLEIDNEASLLFKIGTFPKTSLVFLMALILATPMTWRKKAKSLLICLLIFALYFYLFVYFDVIHHISNSRIGIYELEGSIASFVGFMKGTFCNFGFSLSFVVVLWAVVCIDFNALFNQFNLALQGKSAQPTPIKTVKKSKKGKAKVKTKSNSVKSSKNKKK